MTPLLEVKNLTKRFKSRRSGIFGGSRKTVSAVENVSFEVMPGETFGLVGESGSGKTTLGRSVIRAIEPTSGTVILNLDDGPVDVTGIDKRALRNAWQHMQMVFQDPYASLNLRMTVSEIIGEPLVAHRLANRAQRAELVADMARKCGLDTSYLGRYPHAFSGGQRQRIAIARALVLHPKFIVCDEPVSALDVSIQAQILNLLKNLQRDLGLTYLFIAHDLAAVAYACDRVAVMYLGQLVEVAPIRALYYAPKHPYTEALMSAIPAADPDTVMEPVLLAGERPNPANPPAGCRFHTRCRYADENCRTTPPVFAEHAPGHFASCHYADQLSLKGAMDHRAAPMRDPEGGVIGRPDT